VKGILGFLLQQLSFQDDKDLDRTSFDRHLLIFNSQILLNSKSGAGVL